MSDHPNHLTLDITVHDGPDELLVVDVGMSIDIETREDDDLVLAMMLGAWREGRRFDIGRVSSSVCRGLDDVLVPRDQLAEALHEFVDDAVEFYRERRT